MEKLQTPLILLADRFRLQRRETGVSPYHLEKQNDRLWLSPRYGDHQGGAYAGIRTCVPDASGAFLAILDHRF
jgi:hypothetical protein